jgi:RNA recognition motif-containing protein
MMDDAIDSDSESSGLHGGQLTKLQRLNEEDSLPSKKDEGACSDLIVMGMPFAFEEDELQIHFEQYGKVELCEVCFELGANLLLFD